MADLATLLEALAEHFDVADIQEAAEALEAPKKSSKKGGGKKAAADEDDKPAKGGAGRGKKGAGKKPKGNDDLIADLDDDELTDVAVELELGKEAKLKKMDREDLEALFDDVDPEDLEDAIKEVTGDADGDDEDGEDAEGDDPNYDDMSTKELVAEYVKRKLGSKKEAADMSDDDLIEALEDDDDA